ncbi:hypothetical protein O4J55_05150, partial [Paracoccus sp. PXZ]
MRVGIIGATGWLGSALGAGLLSRQILRPEDLLLLNRSGPRPDYHGHAGMAVIIGTRPAAVQEQQVLRPEDLLLLNRSGPRPDYHGHAGMAWARDAADLVAQSDVVVVSVRPEDWPGLALRAEGRLVLSFMAGIDAATLAGCGGRIVRVMPNAAAEIGASYSPFWAADGVTEADRDTVRLLLSAIGTTDELASEAEIDLMTALPGSGAAYPALMAVAMAGFIQEQGVSEAIAWRAA